jgi:hypothetical protein
LHDSDRRFHRNETAIMEGRSGTRGAAGAEYFRNVYVNELPPKSVCPSEAQFGSKNVMAGRSNIACKRREHRARPFTT